MNFSNISYFLAIVEEGSISAAARKLYISQQALSEQLKKMEAEVGAPLLKRGKSSELTVAGECLCRDGRELLRIYNSMMEDIRDVTLSRKRKITLGIPTFWTPPYLPELLSRIHEKYPEYEITVVKRQHTDIEHNMNGVDLYLSSLPLSPHLENHIVLDSDPFHVTFQRALAEKVYRDRWEAVEAQLIQTQDLALLREMPFIALRDRYGQLMQSLDLIFNEYRFTPTFGFNSENFDLNEHACISGQGCLLSTESHTKWWLYKNESPQARELLSYPVRVTSFEPKIAISHSKGLHLHAEEIRFIQEAKNILGML
ncbi:MAG: LysR family transcriptional regulator [Oscillospiraceae bacterium]